MTQKPEIPADCLIQLRCVTVDLLTVMTKQDSRNGIDNL